MFLHCYVIVLKLTTFIIMYVVLKRSYDARKALQKNGIQLSSGLIVGVKPIDAVHRQQLDESFTRSNQGGFMVSLPSKSFASKSTSASNQLGALPRPYDPKANTNVSRDAGRRATGSVAAPAKSIVTNVMDLIFGIWYGNEDQYILKLLCFFCLLVQECQHAKRFSRKFCWSSQVTESELYFGDVISILYNFSRLIAFLLSPEMSRWGQLYVNGHDIALVVGDVFIFF